MSHQTPMLSSPLKQTVEVDWIQPLKNYIQNSYGADAETYSEECTRLNQLRQDMRGAGKDSIAGRDLLYRYYGQLELLELRFPVDEHHIKISFTWYDAFTQKITSQYSLAYEKASVIYNIAAVLSCHAANQNRHEEAGLKAAFHSFQAAAGMFTYINENFLHAPSTDLSRETVKTLTQIMLGQAQEVFLEKQIEDGKKPALLAKLANQASYNFVQAVEGTQENVDKGVFSRSWLHIVQAKVSYLGALANHFQATADEDAGLHGVAISRWQAALEQIQQALSFAKSVPTTFSTIANLGSETGPALLAVCTRHLDNIREKLNQANKDNDFLYHDIVPSESTLPRIAKLPAAKPIPISELYQNQDVTRIVGPDIFARIIPMPVTEASSIYEEEKARLLRAEAEKVETANGEMLAALDYLKIPDIIPVLKGQVQENPEPSPEVEKYCKTIASGGLLRDQLEELRNRKNMILSTLDRCTTDLDREESTCEKMRLKFGAEWTQQPSAKFSAALKSEMKRYRTAINEASSNDNALMTWWERSEQQIKEMYTAGLNDEVDVMFQEAMIKAVEKSGRRSSANPAPSVGNLLDDVDDSSPVTDQVAQIEELYKKLMLVKKDRTQVLKDLKEKIHADDISQVLLLNKKSLSGQENQIFQSELEKFRAHQTRLTQSNHKQVSLLKEITKVYEEVLQNDRVRAEQAKYDSISKQRNTVIRMYEHTFKAYKDISDSLQQADKFYSDMESQVDSLQKNVEEFLNNRKAEGSQLLQELERKQQMHSAAQGDQDREKLNQLMSRLSVGSSASPQTPQRPDYPNPALPPKAPAESPASAYPPTLTSPYSIPTTAQQPVSYMSYMSGGSPSVGPPSGPPPQQQQQPHGFSPISPPLRRESVEPTRWNYPPNPSTPAVSHTQQTPYPSYPQPGAPAPSQYAPPPSHNAHPSVSGASSYMYPHPPSTAAPMAPPYQTPQYGQGQQQQQQQQPQPQNPYAAPQGYQQPQQPPPPQPPSANDPWAGLNSWR